MTPPLHFVVPGPLDQRTGGYIYDRRMVEGLRALGWAVRVHELAGRFPQADASARAAAAAAIETIAAGDVPVIDGLALPAFVELPDRLPQPWVALIHHPLALETGLTPVEAQAFADLERVLLPRAARVAVTSPRTRQDLAAYDLDDTRIAVVVPGTEPAPLARGSGGPGLALLCVASLTPRKAHAVLLQALHGLRDLDWHLTCVGSAERDPVCARSITAAIDRLGLRQRVSLIGEQPESDLAPFYDRADLFVLPSYHEGYGMVLAEALARGLPVVSTSAGAIPDTVPEDAGLLVPPGDARALAGALRQVIRGPELRAKLSAGARAARRNLP
ncbi:MAG TPA: glycosyltransferase family 4 protein, partial [Geminicoccaceae bacterium]|nr:glycosyltransferase family 4 protein [Geminicoccaceae bacterium]